MPNLEELRAAIDSIANQMQNVHGLTFVMDRKASRRLGGLYKRCACPQATWKRCHRDDHPWYHHFKPKGGTLDRQVLGVMTWEEAKVKRDEIRTALTNQVKSGTQTDGRMSLDELTKLFAVDRARDSYVDILCRQESGGVRLGSRRVKDIAVQHPSTPRPPT